MNAELRPWAIVCATCGDTYWKRREWRSVEDVAAIETNTPSEATLFFDFDDEETQQTKPLGPFKCSNGHPARKAEAERLEALR